MHCYNYAAFAKAFEKGMSKPNMTKMAENLFKPIVSLEGVVNRNGKLYNIDSRYASDWYRQRQDIPKQLKDAAADPKVYNHIGAYFSEEIIDKLINPVKEECMYEALLSLISDSDLPDGQKDDLKTLYKRGEFGEFLGKAFLYSITADNRKKDNEQTESKDTRKDDTTQADSDIESDFEIFKKFVSKHRKPEPILPPKNFAPDEMKYVMALFLVIAQKIGKPCQSLDDLIPFTRWMKIFMRQRKYYYLAETIRRGLRDTGYPGHPEIFDLLKDEMYEGVVETGDREYDSGYNRMNAVLEHATAVVLSDNTDLFTFHWVGPGEKKGICHMLVNDDKLKWMEDDDSE